MRTETCVCALISTRQRRSSADAWHTFWEQGARTPSKAARANDAFSKLLKHGGDLITILPQIAVLLGFAALATVVAVWQLQRTLTS